MRRFIQDVAVFSGINLMILVWLYSIYDVGDDYLAGVNDKLDRLEQKQKTDSPVLLFIGGSSVAWSNHSRLAKEAFPEFEVENMAYHAGLGLTMRMNETRMLTKPGDVVVISIEWGVFSDAPWPRKMAETAMASPRTLAFMSTRDKKLVLDGLLPAVRMPLVSFIDTAKSSGFEAFSHEAAQLRKRWRLRDNFNELGDFEGHYDVPPPGLAGRSVELAQRAVFRRGVERLRKLNEQLDQRGVRLFYFVPIIAKSGYRPIQQEVDAQVQILVEELGFPVLNPHPENYVFADDNYFDSCYHMRSQSGRRRTSILVSALKQHLSESE